MKFKTLTGKLKDIPVHKYLVDWDGKSLSKFQESVKKFFYPYWKHQVVCEELPMPGTRCHFDIVCISAKVLVEIQGISHYDPNSHFHGGSKTKWLSQIKRDESKRKWAELNGFKFVEIFPDDLPKLSPEWFKEQFDITL